MAVVDIDVEAAQVVTDEINSAGDHAIAIGADVRQSEDAQRMVDTTVESLGSLDICVNNAGGMLGHARSRFLDATPEFIEEMLDLNLRAVFHCGQIEARSMVERKTGGSIINVSSLGGMRAVRGVNAYGAAKAGVINLTRTMAVELGPLGIRTNAIAPGTTLTRAVDDTTTARALETTAGANPLRRLARPEDMAGAVIFLASDLSRYVNGQCIAIDGGFEASVGVIARAAT